MENQRLIQALQNPKLYNHSISYFKVIETHLSWILLTGKYAYKIKKAITLNFADFSTLDKRHYYCQEELRLNRRLAPSLYLGLIFIQGSIENLKLNENFNPNAAIIEYAIKMQEFDQALLLSRILTQETIFSPSLLRTIANRLATFHQQVAIAESNSSFGNLKSIQQPMLKNFSECKISLQNLYLKSNNQMNNLMSKIVRQLDSLQQQSEIEFSKLQIFFQQRKENGFIRECHGDCHLGNMVIIDGKVMIFDCLEFNPEFRWIDTISEIAFLTMDLQVHASREAAFYFLNHYLELTGDYSGLKALRFYQTYRAMIRAKVALLTPNALQLSDFTKYISFAEKLNQKPKVKLIITHGLSGSGKTWLATQLAGKIQALHLRSDMERKYLMLNHETADYSKENREKVYQHLLELSDMILTEGYSIIVDATFLHHKNRKPFHDLAKKRNIPFIILHCEAKNETLRKRIVARLAEKTDASEANLLVLDEQLSALEPLKELELNQYIHYNVDTESAHAFTMLLKRFLDEDSSFDCL